MNDKKSIFGIDLRNCLLFLLFTRGKVFVKQVKKFGVGVVGVDRSLSLTLNKVELRFVLVKQRKDCRITMSEEL